MSTTRPRPNSSLPKAPTSLAPTCIIADSAVLTGTHLITISPNAVLHPRAKIVSTHGPVTIGEGCIISERASVGRLSSSTPDQEDDSKGSKGTEPAEGAEEKKRPGVVLEPNVVLEPAATVEGTRVGEGTTLEAASKVSAGAVVGKYCKIAPLCTVPTDEVLEDFTIVFGNNQRRREKPGLEGIRRITHEKEIEVLRRLIPSNLAKWQTEAGTV